jgi:hypothetical protein
MWPKSKLVSMIVSEKALFAGHRFRLALYRGLRNEPSRYPVGLRFVRGNMILAAVWEPVQAVHRMHRMHHLGNAGQLQSKLPTCGPRGLCVCACARVCVCMDRCMDGWMYAAHARARVRMDGCVGWTYACIAHA